MYKLFIRRDQGRGVRLRSAGMVLVAAFTLRALKKSFFGEHQSSDSFASGPISAPEKLGAGLLMFATLAVGIYPKLLLDRIVPAVEAMRFLKP